MDTDRYSPGVSAYVTACSWPGIAGRWAAMSVAVQSELDTRTSGSRAHLDRQPTKCNALLTRSAKCKQLVVGLKSSIPGSPGKSFRSIGGKCKAMLELMCNAML